MKTNMLLSSLYCNRLERGFDCFDYTYFVYSPSPNRS